MLRKVIYSTSPFYVLVFQFINSKNLVYSLFTYDGKARILVGTI